MKRKGRLFEQLISDENIHKAIREVNSTHRYYKGHRPNPIVSWVEDTKEERTKELRQIIINGFEPCPTIHKRVWDDSSGKWRDIEKPKLYPDQYVHHMLVQILEPYIMRGMDFWCCGSVPKRGIKYGVQGIQKWMRVPNANNKYCVELDIRHFYQNINIELVMSSLRKLIKDYRVLDLCERVLRLGVVIGFYPSQWFANLILQPLDKLIRNHEGCKHYIRYVDNLTIFSSNKRELRALTLEIINWLHRRGLELKYEINIFETKNRLPNALGYRFGHGYTIPRKKNLLKMKRQIHRIKKRKRKGLSPTFKQSSGAISRIGQLKYCNNINLIKQNVPKKMQKELKNVIRTQAKLRLLNS